MKVFEEDMEEIENEEEEWIDYSKRSTKKEAEERMKSAEVSRRSLLDRRTQKDEMEIGDVHCIFTRRTMVKQGSRMEPRPCEQR